MQLGELVHTIGDKPWDEHDEGRVVAIREGGMVDIKWASGDVTQEACDAGDLAAGPRPAYEVAVLELERILKHADDAQSDYPEILQAAAQHVVDTWKERQRSATA